MTRDESVLYNYERMLIEARREVAHLEFMIVEIKERVDGSEGNAD